MDIDSAYEGIIWKLKEKQHRSTAAKFYWCIKSLFLLELFQNRISFYRNAIPDVTPEIRSKMPNTFGSWFIIARQSMDVWRSRAKRRRREKGPAKSCTNNKRVGGLLGYEGLSLTRSLFLSQYWPQYASRIYPKSNIMDAIGLTS